MSQIVLDASAILALLNAETGSELVQEVLPNAVLSTVNLCEVAARLSAAGMPENDVREVLSLLGLEAVPFTEEHAYQAGFLKPHTRSSGLSLGDRACLTLAVDRNAPAVTADKAWKNLNLPVEIRLIR
ncbi:MAG: PIN domain-containing protein [Chloroflexi bacterium]|nr:MAG: PIN domain-containing protein [Chloroflexota bacterium]